MSVQNVDIQYLKRSAKRLLTSLQQGDAGAAVRCRVHHPDPLRDFAQAKLADAQCIVAREHGFTSWPKLKQRVELQDRISAMPRHPRIQTATELIDRGDVAALNKLLDDAPDLISARHELDGEINYFSGATLLHYVAWNPTPETRASGLPLASDAAMPNTMPDIARLLLNRGADPHALTLSGSTALGLVLTGRKPSEANLSPVLIDLLLDAGAAIEESEDPVGLALANHNPHAAELLIRRGHPHGLREAAALGHRDRLPDYFDGETLLPEAWGCLDRQTVTDKQVIGTAALFAYVGKQAETFYWLLNQPGDWSVTGANNGTLLHRAAGDGDLDTVQKLVALGADVNNRDNPFRATPQDWADHASQARTLDWLNEQTPDQMDLWQAARWGKLDRIHEICADDGQAVDAVEDVWHLREVTALRIAVMANQPEAVRVLLDRGADRFHIAGDGITPQAESMKIGTEAVRLAIEPNANDLPSS